MTAKQHKKFGYMSLFFLILTIISICISFYMEMDRFFYVTYIFWGLFGVFFLFLFYVPIGFTFFASGGSDKRKIENNIIFRFWIVEGR